MPISSQKIREHFLCPFLKNSRSDIEYILDHITGGWEVWLQVNFGIAMSRHFNQRFSREQSYYPGAGAQYDLCVADDTGAPIYFEIKTQSSNSDDTTAKRLLKDIGKIKDLDNTFKQHNVLIAFAVSGLTNQNEMNNLGHLFASHQVQAYDLNGKNLGRTLTRNTVTLFWFANQ